MPVLHGQAGGFAQGSGGNNLSGIWKDNASGQEDGGLSVCQADGEFGLGLDEINVVQDFGVVYVVNFHIDGLHRHDAGQDGGPVVSCPHGGAGVHSAAVGGGGACVVDVVQRGDVEEVVHHSGALGGDVGGGAVVCGAKRRDQCGWSLHAEVRADDELLFSAHIFGVEGAVHIDIRFGVDSGFAGVGGGDFGGGVRGCPVDIVGGSRAAVAVLRDSGGGDFFGEGAGPGGKGLHCHFALFQSAQVAVLGSGVLVGVRGGMVERRKARHQFQPVGAGDEGSGDSFVQVGGSAPSSGTRPGQAGRHIQRRELDGRGGEADIQKVAFGNSAHSGHSGVGEIGAEEPAVLVVSDIVRADVGKRAGQHRDMPAVVFGVQGESGGDGSSAICEPVPVLVVKEFNVVVSKEIALKRGVRGEDVGEVCGGDSVGVSGEVGESAGVQVQRQAVSAPNDSAGQAGGVWSGESRAGAVIICPVGCDGERASGAEFADDGQHGGVHSKLAVGVVCNAQGEMGVESGQVVGASDGRAGVAGIIRVGAVHIGGEDGNRPLSKSAESDAFGRSSQVRQHSQKQVVRIQSGAHRVHSQSDAADFHSAGGQGCEESVVLGAGESGVRNAAVQNPVGEKQRVGGVVGAPFGVAASAGDIIPGVIHPQGMLAQQVQALVGGDLQDVRVHAVRFARGGGVAQVHQIRPFIRAVIGLQQAASAGVADGCAIALHIPRIHRGVVGSGKVLKQRLAHRQHFARAHFAGLSVQSFDGFHPRAEEVQRRVGWMGSQQDSALHQSLHRAFRRRRPIDIVQGVVAGEAQGRPAGGNNALPQITRLHIQRLPHFQLQSRGMHKSVVGPRAQEFVRRSGGGLHQVGGAEMLLHSSEVVDAGDLRAQRNGIMKEIGGTRPLVDGDIIFQVAAIFLSAGRVGYVGETSLAEGAGTHSAVEEAGFGAQDEFLSGGEFGHGQVLRSLIAVAGVSAVVYGQGLEGFHIICLLPLPRQVRRVGGAGAQPQINPQPRRGGIQHQMPRGVEVKEVGGGESVAGGDASVFGDADISRDVRPARRAPFHKQGRAKSAAVAGFDAKLPRGGRVLRQLNFLADGNVEGESFEVFLIAFVPGGGAASAFGGDGHNHREVFQRLARGGRQHFMEKPSFGAGFDVAEKVQSGARGNMPHRRVQSRARAGAGSGRLGHHHKGLPGVGGVRGDIFHNQIRHRRSSVRRHSAESDISRPVDAFAALKFGGLSGAQNHHRVRRQAHMALGAVYGQHIVRMQRQAVAGRDENNRALRDVQQFVSALSGRVAHSAAGGVVSRRLTAGGVLQRLIGQMHPVRRGGRRGVRMHFGVFKNRMQVFADVYHHRPVGGQLQIPGHPRQAEKSNRRQNAPFGHVHRGARRDDGFHGPDAHNHVALRKQHKVKPRLSAAPPAQVAGQRKRKRLVGAQPAGGKALVINPRLRRQHQRQDEILALG